MARMGAFLIIALIVILGTIVVLSFTQRPPVAPKGPQIQKVIIKRDIKLKEGTPSAK